jgi:prophage regulatory protein
MPSSTPNIKFSSETRFIRVGEVKNLTGLSRSYIYALSADGLFPRSVPLVPGGTSRAWVYSEVQDWLNQRVDARALEGSR